MEYKSVHLLISLYMYVLEMEQMCSHSCMQQSNGANDTA